MPAIPIAESSAPIVVGISATSSAISTVCGRGRARVDRERPQRHDGGEEGDRQPGEQDVERDLVRGLAPLGALDERDHAVEERLARLLRDLDHEPVGEQLRAAGDGRAVAAGLADHRRRLAGDRRLVDRADALDDLAVGRDDLAGLDDDDVAALQLRRRHLLERSVSERRCAVVVVRVARSAFACALPRPSAIASAKFANSTVSQSQTDDHADEPEPPVVAADEVEDEDRRRDHAAELDDEHHRVADLQARVELRERVADRRERRGRARRCWSTCVPSALCPVEGEVELEHVDAGLAEEAQRAPVRVLADQLLDGRERQVPHGGDAPRLQLRVGRRDVRVDARARGRDRVDRDVADREAGVVRAARA